MILQCEQSNKCSISGWISPNVFSCQSPDQAGLCLLVCYIWDKSFWNSIGNNWSAKQNCHKTFRIYLRIFRFNLCLYNMSCTPTPLRPAWSGLENNLCDLQSGSRSQIFLIACPVTACPSTKILRTIWIICCCFEHQACQWNWLPIHPPKQSERIHGLTIALGPKVNKSCWYPQRSKTTDFSLPMNWS